MLQLLLGPTYVTSSEDVIFGLDYNKELVRVISLDEDEILPESPMIIGGTTLLPPIPAKIAEADGNEPLYDQLYHDHLISKFNEEYIAAVLSFLALGGKIVFFVPSVLDENYTRQKFLYHFSNIYGIIPGDLDSKDPVALVCKNDTYNHQQQWADLIYYYTNQFTAYQYMIYTRFDVQLNSAIMNKLLSDLKPYASTIEEKINIINELRKQLQVNPNITIPVEGV